MQGSLFGAALLGAITLMSSIALMATSGWLISQASQMPPVLTLSVAVVGVRTFALSRGVARYAERLVSHNATFKSLTGIHRAIFDRLELLAPAGLPAFRSGDLLARLVADVDSVQDLPLRVLMPIFSGVLAASFAIGLTAWILPAAGLILFLTLMFAALVIPAITIRSAAKSEQATAQTRGELVNELIEFYSGNADIIALGQHEVALTRISQIDSSLTKAASKQAYTIGLASGLLTLAQGVAIIASTWAGIVAFKSGQLDGVLLAVLAMIPMAAFESVSNFPSAALALSRVRGSSTRIIEIIEKPLPVIEPAKSAEFSGYPIDLKSISASWFADTHNSADIAIGDIAIGDIAIGDTAIHDIAGQDVAVQDVTFKLPENTSIGLVGPSGSGKSTIISVLLKFLTPSTGSYQLGGVNSTELTGTEIRKKLILNSPEQHVFATSIVENLKLASAAPETLTDAQIWQVLEKVDLAQWVKSLPNQLETLIGERGSTMSGGQKQRLTLARLFIANPQVWILDEPTEHLDSKLADRILAALVADTVNSSLIVASHRPADTANLDQIFKVSRPK
jgi:thiol reductant ABC exporter CydC subunit